MKNKKTFVGIILLIVVLAIGIGYAAITGSLEITGTATTEVDTSNLNVVFTGDKVVPEGTTATVTEGSKTATITVGGLKKTGDTKEVKLTIANKSAELKALVDVKTETISNGDYFSIDATVANPNTELDIDGTTEVTVKVTLNKTPIEVQTATINVALEATAVLGE